MVYHEVFLNAIVIKATELEAKQLDGAWSLSNDDVPQAESATLALSTISFY